MNSFRLRFFLDGEMSIPSSMSTNLVGRLRNTRLPRTHGLLPLFEAVVNSLHAVEEAKLPTRDGRIVVTVDREPVLSLTDSANTRFVQGKIVGFRVTDNGVGFNDPNMKSFCTLDSDYKVGMGGRGVGRLLWLKAFHNVRVDSNYMNDAGLIKKRTFMFNATNGVAEQSVADTDEVIAEPGTTVHLEGFRSEYRESSRKQTDAIARQLLEHCLWYFIRPGGAPWIELYDEGQRLLLDDVYDSHMHTSASSESIVVKECDFELVHMKLRTYSFTGAVKGVVIQQVEVLPEELTVHLGSYGAGAGGNRRVRSLRTEARCSRAATRRAVTRVNSEQAPKDCRGRRPAVNTGKADEPAAPQPSATGCPPG